MTYLRLRVLTLVALLSCVSCSDSGGGGGPLPIDDDSDDATGRDAAVDDGGHVPDTIDAAPEAEMRDAAPESEMRDAGEADEMSDAGDAGGESVPSDAGETFDPGDADLPPEPPTNLGPPISDTVVTAPTACESGLIAGGARPLCASCACGRCEAPAQGCAADALCRSALACMHESGCTGSACYCGTGPFGCTFGASGACKAEFEAAAAATGEGAIKAALENESSALGKAALVQACTRGEGLCHAACSPDDEACSFHDQACIERYCSENTALEAQRAASAMAVALPRIDLVRVNGQEAWRRGQNAVPSLKPGDKVKLEGVGFGAGVDVDFAKVLVGSTRILETDLTMYEQKLDIAKQVNYEVNTVRSTWPKDILSFTDTQIEFRVPTHVVPTTGSDTQELKITVQKRVGANYSYTKPGELHAVVDTQQMRIVDDKFPFRCDVVSELSLPRASNSVAVKVTNSAHESILKRGREIYWSYDYNIGLAHQIRGLDWTAIFAGKTTDPITGLVADPKLLFGAYPTKAGEVPDEAIKDVAFDPYPMKNPIPGLLTVGQQKFKGNTKDSGFVGYRYAEAVNPYTGDGSWIGFNCASCHSYRISYEKGATTTTRVVPGLPNPRWTMKWALLGNFKGVVGEEPGPIWQKGNATIDKTAIVYAMPAGTGEHNVIRMNGEGSHTDNDYEFSPITIPNVTYYLPVRRSLGHTEAYVGFEGSYVHSEEPDGAMGSMDAESLKAFTAYMGTLDSYDDDLRAVGLYRWLKFKNFDDLPANLGEGEFVSTYTSTMDASAYPALEARLLRGKATFEQRCGTCHVDPSGDFSNERMIPLAEVGRFFAPTIYQKEVQSIRVTFLRDLYFTQHRGLLTDGHVRTAEDLVHPDRCTEGTPLYNRYYTLHAPSASQPAVPSDFPALTKHENPRGDVFRVIKSPTDTTQGKQRNAFVERYRYFSDMSSDANHYYWDYQRFIKEYGPWELGTAKPLGLPKAPHPWCAQSAAEVTDLVVYLMPI